MIRKLENMNDDHDKEMLNENTNNFQRQNSLTYEFSSLDKVATEEKNVKSSLLRNVNRLIFGQININPSEISLSYFSLWFEIILVCY